MIKDKKSFIENGTFYKGNTHTHTKNSDGQAYYEDRIRDYKEHGYNFLVLSDHEYYSAFEGFNTDSFILFPGMEFECGPKADESALGYHTTCFALPSKNTIPSGSFTWSQGTSIDDQLKYVQEHGNYCIAAHPYWLGMKPQAITGDFDKGVIGMEVFNSVCHFGFGTGYSEGYLDYAIQQGYRPLIFAADDYHGPAFTGIKDYCCGYIMVKASELSYEAIVDSILKGSFYASFDGPSINNFEIKDGKAIVDCDPCFQISLRSPQTFGYQKHSFDYDITHAEFNLNGYEQCVRAVVDDGKGHVSWTQILNVERN